MRSILGSHSSPLPSALLQLASACGKTLTQLGWGPTLVSVGALAGSSSLAVSKLVPSTAPTAPRVTGRVKSYWISNGAGSEMKLAD